MNNVVETIRRDRIIGVIRVGDAETAVLAALAVAEGGVRIIEIPATVPNFTDAIRQLARRPEIVVGAASILNASQAEAAIDAGAAFLVSPIFTTDVSEIASESELFYLPGASTPTEVHSLMKDGFEIIKVFPAGHLGGPGYLRALLSVMPRLKLVPTGGVSEANAADYLAAGAFAVGVGGALLPEGLVERRDWAGISRITSQLVSSVER
ncbi:bifunctional 4-hydroxy-2-oxoglutarate aldolase/2-dehydro-3-deoxy-phosphogluconate aldolase [bacterium]|nr:bifunctional 4-hydroxy-2-oxoglutarate aldolase/2-dehydro-3-deoxy-phosphogluconate aldolase [bacterium]